MTKRYIVWHGPACFDGMGAAFAFWLKYRYENTEYIPVNYGYLVPKMDDGSEVYIVDFSYSPEELLDLAKRMSKVVVIDHHDTAQEKLKGLDLGPGNEIIFDMSKSGAVLAHEYLYPEYRVPDFFYYIQDRDLWQWKLNKSRGFSAGLASVPQTFESWYAYMHETDKLIDRGSIILDYQNKQIEKLLHATTNKVVGEYVIPCVNTSLLQSEVCEKLLEKYPGTPFVGCYYENKDQDIIWSLRSRKDFSCNKVAEKLGGGGHPQAAGFSIKKE